MKYFFLFVASAILSGQVVAQVNLSNGLTACYALNGNATEPISGLTGTLSGPTPTVNRFNTPNSAMYFNGQTQFIELPDDPLLKPANAISFSCWLYGTQLTDAYILFTENSLPAYFEAYELCIDPDLTFMSRKAGPLGLNQVNSTTLFTTNTWFHVVITIDNSFVKIYVNGQLEATTASTFNGFNYTPGKKVVIGATNSWYEKPFKGIIDNMRFYNRTLNAAEVLALYNTDPACLLQPEAVIVAPSTVCVGAVVQFTDASTNSPTQWSWTMPGSSNGASSQQHPQATYATAGVYTVSLMATGAAGTATTSTTINVLPAPTINAAATKTLVCSGSFITVTASGANSYTWQPINVVASTTVIPLQSSITLTITGTGSNGCSSVTYLPIQTQVCESITDIQSQLGFDVVYNAGKKELSLIGTANKEAILNLYSYDLKLMKRVTALEQEGALCSTEDLAPGIYIMLLETESGKVTKKLFVN